jgi:hypothetical protein
VSAGGDVGVPDIGLPDVPLLAGDAVRFKGSAECCRLSCSESVEENRNEMQSMISYLNLPDAFSELALP